MRINDLKIGALRKRFIRRLSRGLGMAGKVAATEIKAPNAYDATKRYTIFLAGAIDQGQAEDWQEKVARALDEFDVTVLNPRREDWDPSWDQEANNPEFRRQVEWELDAQEAADMVIFVFTKDSKAPITFLEFGLFAPHKDAVVCAEEGFYRQGNLDIVAERHNIPMYHDLDEMIGDLQTTLREKV
jgi:nucleoside 2-deoxyribosyltransferase